VVTDNEEPVVDRLPHRGLKLEAVSEFKRKHRVSAIVTRIVEDFDTPLPEEFLIRPLA